MGDLFHDEVPVEFIWKVLLVMIATPDRTFQVLTKRSSLMRDFLRTRYGGQRGPANIWCGVSVEDAPGERQASSGLLYLAYLRDPDGNKLCAIKRM